MPKAQPDHYYGFGPQSGVCVRCGIIRRPVRHANGQPKTNAAEWSSDGGVTWSRQHTACPGLQPKGTIRPKPDVRARS